MKQPLPFSTPFPWGLLLIAVGALLMGIARFPWSSLREELCAPPPLQWTDFNEPATPRYLDLPQAAPPVDGVYDIRFDNMPSLYRDASAEVPMSVAVFSGGMTVATISPTGEVSLEPGYTCEDALRAAAGYDVGRSWETDPRVVYGRLRTLGTP